MSSSLVMIICMDVGIVNVRHRLGTHVCKPSRGSRRSNAGTDSGWRKILELFVNPTYESGK